MTRARRVATLAAILVGLAAGESQGQSGSPSTTGAVGGSFVNVIVALDPRLAAGDHPARQNRAAQIARELGLEPQVSYGTTLLGFAASVPEGRLAALSRDPRVLYVNRDTLQSIPVPRAAANPGGSGATASGDQVPWGVQRICGGQCTTGSGIHAYVIDSGIDSDHPDLRGGLGNGYAVEACKGSTCKTAWDDDNGHGTHVAGTIGARSNGLGVLGVAPAVTLHAVKVLNRSGSGYTSRIIAGIDWVANQAATPNPHAVVANMSIGGAGSKKGSCTSAGFTGSDAYHQALCNAARKGVIFAVAAGNDGADAQQVVPAAYDDAVIAASATGRTSDLQKQDWPSWSNWGDGYSGSNGTFPAAPVGLAAPGVNVLSTCYNGGTCTKSGTSMASPHLAGAAGLLLQNQPQQANYSAFLNTRGSLLTRAESTTCTTASTCTTNFANSSGHPHPEVFLNAGGVPAS